ncbi:7-deoxyloganetin glucosyltransferase-like [Andrographis paniculata]|uniref:7-deoxyloganetin glucosyltransferase-like n=1 Tax=Andrographis paniculata TaxID=175694 RepID=UPI001E7535EE|nr:7-deoxyloganetin glucosyltransferase-like [Andrographis paniculata]QZJ84681.1 UDP-glycosyltransferase 10 [Andrographis paniculata]
MGSVPAADSGRPHAVCIPFPAQGHVNPMMKLAKLLHQNGFHVTFVNTEYNHRRLVKSLGEDAVDGLPPSFQFRTIPDGLPPSYEGDATQDIPSLCASTSTTCLAPFRALLADLNTGGGGPPVSCIVSDGVMSFTLDAAAELGVPEVLFWTTSACGFYGYTQYDRLIQDGLVPLKDSSDLTNGYLDSTILEIPGMEGIRLRDIPSFVRTTNPDEFMVKFALRETARARRASAIIVNTFEVLEQEVLNQLSSTLPPVYAIGPLNLLEHGRVQNNTAVASLGSSLWKEDSGCLEWLDSQAENSVVYVNFGSIAVMTADQLAEFAWGLANSGQSFLWVIRPDLVSGEQAILPRDFLVATEGRGMLAGWCPQERVLGHSAVGGFLTHSGWNSTLESLSAGVPMICWPFFAEQPTNCWYCCAKWGVGMEIESDVTREGVESLVRELMAGEKGRELKNRAGEWEKLAREAAAGSAYDNLKEVISVLLSSE